MKFEDANSEQIQAAVEKAWNTFHIYRKYSLKRRAAFMRSIADELGSDNNSLVNLAMRETHLTEARLKNELGRTIFQLNSYAEACENGTWLEARIDTAIPDRNPPKPDIRKMLIPLGPVVVFGASNFPFAYSTAGGDTACALAAGCPVIVKGHPAHAETSQAVADAIMRAARKMNLPEGIFTHLHGASHEVGEALVKHPRVKGVGFTGSFAGGRQLFDWANQRKEPIPVFAEMSSVNPIFLLPDKLRQSTQEIAKMIAGSVTLGVGQFCTNPGLIIGLESDELNQFMNMLREEIEVAQPAAMLHSGIFRNYVEKKALALSQEQVDMVATAESTSLEEGIPTIASASGQAFLNNPVLHQEVFGPFSLVVRCKDMVEMIQIANQMEGQLTGTVIATEKDLQTNEALMEAVIDFCGRFIINSVPTGVEVCLSMHHGGPFPSTTDSRFTSVGADGIRRFARPLCYQNWPDTLLPDELKNANPLNIYRTVNNKLTTETIEAGK